eukprot:UN03431
MVKEDVITLLDDDPPNTTVDAVDDISEERPTDIPQT